MSCAVFLALMKITGMSRNSSFFFTARHSSKPSIQLIITSSRMRSGRSTWRVEMRRRPLAAWVTSLPSSSRAILSISRVSRSSSTMMIFLRPAMVPFGCAEPSRDLPPRPLVGAERGDAVVLQQQLHLPLRLLELGGAGPRQLDALLERRDRFLQRQATALQALDHLGKALDDLLVPRFLGGRRALGHRLGHCGLR